jgi:hypothetical protein
MPEPRIVKSGQRISYHETVSYHETLTLISRFGAFRAAPLTARGAEEAAAPPAPRNRLQRIAHQLSHQKKFDHAASIVPDG